MSNLDNYVEYIKKKIQKQGNMTETEIIRFVYLDLGMRFSFDVNFIFGNSKERRRIYENSKNKKELELCMKKNVAVCKSLSYICEYIYKKLGINISVEILDEYTTNEAHVYNIITEKSGKSYIIDLQQDLDNIQSHSRTECFGVESVRKREPILKPFELEQIDKKIGYIQDDNYYSDDYLYLLKSDIGYFSKSEERIQFLIENIDIYENKNMKYLERKWHHAAIMEKVLSLKDFSKVHFIDCYKLVQQEKEYQNCIVYYGTSGLKIYMYSIEENRYIDIGLENFAKQIKNR